MASTAASYNPTRDDFAAMLDESFAGARIDWVEQAKQLGTGHALAQALPKVARGSQVLVLNRLYMAVQVMSVRNANPVALVRSAKVLLTKAAVARLEELLK